MRILITGAGGFIGYHLARRLADEGHALVLVDDLRETRALDREFATLVEHDHVTFHRCDVSRIAHVAHPGFDVAFHLAATVGVGACVASPHEVFVNCTSSTWSLLKSLAELEIRRLVFASSSEVYAEAVEMQLGAVPTDERVPLVIREPGRPRGSYAEAKLVSELSVRHYCGDVGIPFVIARLHNVYGPRMGVRHVVPEVTLRAARRENPFRLRSASATRAFTFVDDVTRALSALSHCGDNQTLHVGSGEATSIRDLCRSVMAIVGHAPEIIEETQHDDWAQHRCPDPRQTIATTGRACDTPLTVGLAETCRWYLNAYGHG